MGDGGKFNCCKYFGSVNVKVIRIKSETIDIKNWSIRMNTFNAFTIDIHGLYPNTIIEDIP